MPAPEAVDLEAQPIRPPRAFSAASPILLVVVGALLLLSTADVPVFSLDPDLVGFGLVLVGLGWLLRRLTDFGQGPREGPGPLP